MVHNHTQLTLAESMLSPQERCVWDRLRVLDAVGQPFHRAEIWQQPMMHYTYTQVLLSDFKVSNLRKLRFFFSCSVSLSHILSNAITHLLTFTEIPKGIYLLLDSPHDYQE